MPIQNRADGDIVVLSNFGRLMDDPRHFDASRDVGEMIDKGSGSSSSSCAGST